MSVRVRCAPSPTGHLHIGVARTALFNYLFAKKQNGQFLLRIEDTDQERSREVYVESILEGLEWFGTPSDEPPVRQSRRLEAYRRLIDRLVSEGKAYYCDCPPERLETLRKSQTDAGKNPGYDGRCRDRTDVEPEGAVVRLKTPRGGSIRVEDPVYGNLEFDLAEIDDFVIAKSDGFPTYQLAVVADDHAQEITHVIRGNDLSPSTPRQILLYQAFGWEPPVFVHIPLLHGKDNQKLSKRHGATSLLAYRALGFLPQAMRNYLVRLGWSYGDQEVFTFEEMVEKFSLEGIGRSPAVFNPEKLLWLNAEHIRRLEVPDLVNAWFEHLEHVEEDRHYLEGLEDSHEIRVPDLEPLKDPANKEWVESLVGAFQERSTTLVELTFNVWPFLSEEIEYDSKAVRKHLKPAARKPLEKVRDWIESHTSLPSNEAIHEFLTSLAEELDVKLGKVAQPVRVSVTGRSFSPPIDVTLQLLGREKILRRIERGLSLIGETETP